MISSGGDSAAAYRLRSVLQSQCLCIFFLFPPHPSISLNSTNLFLKTYQEPSPVSEDNIQRVFIECCSFVYFLKMRSNVAQVGLQLTMKPRKTLNN